MSNTAKKQSEQDGRTYLKERLIDVEEAFIGDLKRLQKRVTHNGVLGGAAENAWIELLKQYLPGRYKVAKAFAIDHLGKTTAQLDCLIYDAHFTPALFGKDDDLYVPAEAVYATFEIKHTITANEIKDAADKLETLRNLQRTSVALKSSHGVNAPKPLLPIIGGLLGMNASWSDGLGVAFLNQWNELKDTRHLDLLLTAESGFCDQLNGEQDPTIISGSGSLIRGLLRLLRALRDKVSVPAADWEKYESVFDEILDARQA